MAEKGWEAGDVGRNAGVWRRRVEEEGRGRRGERAAQRERG